MVAPVQKDNLTDYQVALATYLRITSPVAGMFTGSEIKPNPNARSIRVPDIRVDDYIVDADISRIGADHYSGSEFTGEWKNGVPRSSGAPTRCPATVPSASPSSTSS